jgi:VanZ like family
VTKAKSDINKVVALLLLCLGTIALFNDFERYLVGPELLTDNRFQEKLEHWQHPSPEVTVPVPGYGIAVLQSKNPDVVTHLNQTISNVDNFKLLRLSCDIKSLNIQAQDMEWRVAHILLFSNDRDGNPVDSRPHNFTSLTGSHDWEHHEGVFPVYADSPSVSLYAQITMTTGTLLVRSLSLRPVVEKPSFTVYRHITITLWALAGIWIVAPIVKSAIGNPQRTIVLVLALAVVAGVLMPEPLKEYFGRTLNPSLTTEPSGTISFGTFQFLPLLRTRDIFKLGHFILFTLLAAAALYRRPYAFSRSGTFACLILFAFVTEVLQLFVPGRTALLSDVIIDSAGIVTGQLLLRMSRADTRIK